MTANLTTDKRIVEKFHDLVINRRLFESARQCFGDFIKRHRPYMPGGTEGLRVSKRMVQSRVVQVIQIVFLAGILIIGGVVTQSYAQDGGRKLMKPAGQALSIPEIVDVLVSFAGWDSDLQGNSSGACQRFFAWREIVLQRQGAEEVKALSAVRYDPERDYYQTLKITGPVLQYVSTVNVCDASANRLQGGCDSRAEWTIEAVSKTHVKVVMKVLRGGSGAGVTTGQTCTVNFRKK